MVETRKAKVNIVIYSLYHHVYTLAKSIQVGLESQGVEVKILQVQETLPAEVLVKMHAPPRPDLPIVELKDLEEADGFLFGFGTRFGIMPAQFKAFLDSTGGAWATNSLAGKFVGTFFSTAGQHGGQETTALTTIPFFAHHGLIYVPLGPSKAAAHIASTTEIVGGSPYGCGTITGSDASRPVSDKEKDIAVAQGENFGKLVKTYVAGLSA